MVYGAISNKLYTCCTSINRVDILFYTDYDNNLHLHRISDKEWIKLQNSGYGTYRCMIYLSDDGIVTDIRASGKHPDFVKCSDKVISQIIGIPLSQKNFDNFILNLRQPIFKSFDGFNEVEDYVKSNEEKISTNENMMLFRKTS